MKLHWLEQAATDVPADNDWLSAGEATRLSALRVPKRRSDWRLGRWTAKHAVAACLNLPGHSQALASIEIRPADSGAPEVFFANQRAGVSISLSHRAGVAACAVAPLGTALGCDLELIEPRSAGFLADYFTADEQELVARASPADRDRVVNLLWSAKESVLKALGVGLRENCLCTIVRSVEGLLCQDRPWQVSQLQSRPGQNKDGPNGIENSTLASLPGASLWHPLQVAYTGGRVFQGWWQQSDSLLRTMVASPPSKPPVMLTGTA